MAISKSSDGWTWVESRECIGCGICVDECRYDAIKITKQKAIICDLCWGDPEGVKRCPTEALEYVEAPESFETPETVFKRLREAWKIE
jgi:Fe-S-cluster-containing hydrogenase component 2